MTGPMEGVRVLDLSEGYEGYAGQMLAEFGASVIKVEPVAGDHLRQLGPPFVAGESAAFMGVNRGKKSVAIAWKQPGPGRGLLDQLISQADVLINTLYIDQAEALALTYEDVRVSNPTVIYCSITPMGDTGPEARYRASDLEMQGMFGHWRYLGDPKFHHTDEPPLRLGVPVAAMTSSVFAHQGVTAALIHRKRTGQGQKIMISEAASLTAMKNIQFAAESEPDEYEGHNVGHLRTPFTGTPTKDRDIYWGFSGADLGLPKFIEAIGLGDLLKDAKFEGGSDRIAMGGPLKAQIDERITELTAEEATRMMREFGGSTVYHNTFEGVSKDEQSIAMGMVAEFQHPTAGAVGTTGLPWRFSTTSPELGVPPLLGQHTFEVLRTLGVTDADLAGFVGTGVIHQAQP